MPLLQQPTLEKIDPVFGSSFSYRTYLPSMNQRKDSFWHYHPEIEIVYVNGGSGKRQIGSHISYFRNGDLILIGSNLPHCAFTDSLTEHKCETVIQLKPDFLGEAFFGITEMKGIRNLLDMAQKGIIYHGNTKRRIGKQIEGLSKKENFEKLIGLLKIFRDLETAENHTVLNAQGFVLETNLQDNNRINIIFNFVKEEFKRPISLDEISEKVSMTNPAFCRYFKKITGKTFTKFVNEYRLAHAAKLLHEEQMSITDVCYESGFNNFSHFNKEFKKFTGKSPTVYRNELKYMMT
ncbi:AraC family transcriptional regulator [Gramella sp. AN32]|uniref:AraC family transcriptional regulator n=1 Tax=Christiangramia antarctica TaxID=2058158 RepID=A0ABW5X9E6_9FLAO|nr:AraC family transcriptional regulator [Gramella sp. AN32]MCM4157417.1 AraC family transcriptional regulator [Gramella sp. AN32]